MCERPYSLSAPFEFQRRQDGGSATLNARACSIGSRTGDGGVAVGGVSGAVVDGQLGAVDVQRPRAAVHLVDGVEADGGHLRRARSGSELKMAQGLIRVWAQVVPSAMGDICKPAAAEYQLCPPQKLITVLVAELPLSTMATPLQLHVVVQQDTSLPRPCIILS